MDDERPADRQPEKAEGVDWSRGAERPATEPPERARTAPAAPGGLDWSRTSDGTSPLTTQTPSVGAHPAGAVSPLQNAAGTPPRTPTVVGIRVLIAATAVAAIAAGALSGLLVALLD